MTQNATLLSYSTPRIEPLTSLPHGLIGYSARGCGQSGENCDLLLPSDYLFFSVPPDVEVRLHVQASGIRELEGSATDVARVVRSPSGDLFEPAGAEAVPSRWAELVGVRLFRRTRLAVVRVNLVVSGDGSLLTSTGIDHVLEHGPHSSGRPSRPGGREGELLSILLERDARGWRAAGPDTGDRESPFWGRPWVRIEVDTAGICQLHGSDIPAATGSMTSTLALFTGRGREMGQESPWDEAYEPIPVSLIVDDGGDGLLDSGDRLLFPCRGLSWWESVPDSTASHYTHRYDHANCYWLTWGGEGGPLADTVSGEHTGAPSLPSVHLARRHYESEVHWMRGLVPSDWVWDRNSGSGTQWLHHLFSLPGCTGEGYLRVYLRSEEYGRHRIRVYMNQVTLADTSWEDLAPFELLVPCDEYIEGDNRLSVEIVREYSSETVVLDWFEVFYDRPNSGMIDYPIQTACWGVTGRRALEWDDALDDRMVVLVENETSATVVVPDSGSQVVELELSPLEETLVYLLRDEEDLLSPVSVSEAGPGRILGTMDGADRLYVVADHLMNDLQPLAERDAGGQMVTLTEVFDEMNGGVKDPQAIRALADLAVSGWSAMPLDLILVGNGHYDPRGFQTTRPSYIEPLYEPGGYVNDDIYALTSADTLYPQMAVSRICTSNRTDVEVIADLSLQYCEGLQSGDWQARILGAADDERSGKHNQDEVFHTEDMENLLENDVPTRFRALKHYMIFYDWNDLWKKPEAREDFIELWNEGAMMVLFLGHGAAEQLADEGLMYIEDADLLHCSGRLPVAFFGSCAVGEYHSPFHSCIAQEVTTCPGGGAIAGIGATGLTAGTSNANLMSELMQVLLEPGAGPLSSAQYLLVAKIHNGYSSNDLQYTLFGDGSVMPAVVSEAGFDLDCPGLMTGELAGVDAVCPGQGFATVMGFESSRPDTYYTFRQSKPIAFIASGSAFFDGSATAYPGFHIDMFVPVDADTGSMARVQSFFVGEGIAAAAAEYPLPLGYGSPSGADTTGPEIELWIAGFRNDPSPSVTGEPTVCAILSDSSGINLLGNTGRQLVLYVDGSPGDVSGCFSYYPGSWTTGSLETSLPAVEPGEHSLELRASDGVLNRSSETMSFTLTETDGMTLTNVFVYPNPCPGQACFNWTLGEDALVSIEIFTISGRKILDIGNISGRAGYNQYQWDGLDQDGDRLASGSYLFRIAASAGASGGVAGSACFTGLLAVLR